MKETKVVLFSRRRLRSHLRWARGGFTLIELMVTIVIAAILLMVAVPSFNEASLGGKLRSYANSLVASSHLARSEAIKRNAVVTLCVSTNGTACATGGWEQGWIVLATDGTVVQRQPVLATGFKVTEAGGAASLGFQPSGMSATSATFTVCRATPSVGHQEREVKISATGRPSVERKTTGVCS